MATSQPNPQPLSGTSASRLTAQNVIEMFKEIGLPVCDDGALIAQKIKEQTPRRLRQKNSTTPTEQQKAIEWFKSAEALQNRRAELIDIVYTFFADSADLSLAGFTASGAKTLTGEIEKSLLTLAFRQSGTDQLLADRFLARYSKEKDLPPIGGQLIRPSPVSGFTATSGKGRISLNWTRPTSQCDEVVIVRERDDRSATDGSEDQIYRGTGQAFTDSGLEPGAAYRYRIRSFYQGVEGPDTVERAVSVGDVRSAAALWNSGQIEVSWNLPGDTPVAIFRRANAPPTLTSGASGPAAADESTQQVYRGSATSWIDRDVTEGTVYIYRLIGDFGAGLFSDGVDVQVTVPKPPPPVASVRATYKRHQDEDVVEIDWTPVPRMPAQYLVVRRDGSAPAGDVHQGMLLEKTGQARFLDRTVTPGQRCSYAVFTSVGDVVSRTGTAAAPVDILADVSALTIDSGAGAAELRWRTPPNATGVIVRRSLAEPADHTDGTLVTLSGTGNAKDEGLLNGRRYHYLVCCTYRPDGAHEVFSRGVRTSVVPDRPPDPVSGFKASAQGQEVLCTWQEPPHGQAIVLRTETAPAMSIGTRITADAANALGERLVAGASRAVDPKPDISRPWYCVFTVAGGNAVFGGASAAVVCADVSGLTLAATREGVVLRWVWPASSKMVRVVRRTDTWPEGPDDPAATSVACSHAEYQNDGEKFVDIIVEERARFYYVVYAQPIGAVGMLFAPGSDAGCRETIEWAPRMTLRYSLAPPADRGQRGRSLRLVWHAEQPLEDFAGFVLVASQHQVPNAPDDGIVLFEWKPNGLVGGRHEGTVSLEPIKARRWARFFVKAIVTSRAQSHVTLLVHPNVSQPILDTGEIGDGHHLAAAAGPRPGVPEFIVCPHCFEKFPVGNMLFSSFAGGDSRPGKYTWLQRMKNQPPQPPIDDRGKKLTRKLCPNGHVLPFTAGAQPSLVIGLIGAKFSGKSHYIASLVSRLQSQVSADLQAALLPVSDETQERYRREFYDPLFGSCLELPLTVGAPPPLIYDLTLDGRLWADSRDRTVTLSLYDTAGENLRDSQTVQQMLKYLRVASGVIFLVDPLQAPAVRDALPAKIKAPPLDPEAEPSAMLSRVLQELEESTLVTRAGALETPVAVVLTKCDVLRDAGLMDANRLWASDKRHVGYFDLEAHEDMSGMMSEYVQRWSPGAYQVVSRRFKRHAFFGASATGCASDAATRRYKYISPWRVEDPLLWLLSVLGVLPSRGPEA